MLVENSIYVNKYVANGDSVEFTIDYPFLENSHVKVLTGDGTFDEEIPATEYTITGAGNPNGGTVTFNTAPAAGTIIVITRNVPITQLHEYTELDNFPAESHENSLAKLTMICQELKAELERAIKIPYSSDKTPEEWWNEFWAAYLAALEAAARAEAAARSAQSMPLSVKAFGAVGDGITDDTAAFKAAALAAAATHSAIFVPPGDYVVNEPVSGNFFSVGGVTLSSRYVQVVDKFIAGSHTPIDIVGGPSFATLILRSDQRGGGPYSRAVVQSAVWDPVGNQLFMLHLKTTIDPTVGSRYASISRHPFSVALDVGTLGISSDIAEVGHQGLAVEVLPAGGIKLWSSHNYGLHGGTALRFDYNDSAYISNVQEYVLVDFEGNFSLTPSISSDQRFLIIGYLKNGMHFLRIFDLAMLRAGGPGDYSNAYLTEFPIYPLKASGVPGFQAVACDGWHVYILASDTSTSTPAAIYCYTIQGEFVSKNMDITLGFAESEALGSDWCEAEALFLMPVNGVLRLCLGVNVASAVDEEGRVLTKNFHVFALNAAGGWHENPHFPELVALNDGDNVQTKTENGIYFKPTTISITNWPADIGTNGLLLNFGRASGTPWAFQLVARAGTTDSNNYQLAYRVNSYQEATRWWYPATLFARCHIAADGTQTGHSINIASVTQISGTEYTIVLDDDVDLSSVIVISPTYSSSVVTGSGSIASDGKTISVQLSAAVPFSMVVL